MNFIHSTGIQNTREYYTEKFRKELTLIEPKIFIPVSGDSA